MNPKLRYLAFLLFRLPGFSYAGKQLYRGMAAAFTLLARLSPDVDEVWALGSLGTKDVVPMLSDLDFLLVLSASADAEAAQKKWTARFGRLCFFYSATRVREHLFFLTAEEWERLHPALTARGATRGVPLFQRQRWSPLPQPQNFPATFPLKDRMYRALDLFHLFQVPLRQHAFPTRWTALFFNRLKRRLEKLLGCQIPHDAQWTARFLRRLNHLAESLHAANKADLAPFIRTAEDPLTLPDGFTFPNKSTLRFARHHDVDHWIVDPLTEADYERAVEAYRTTRRRFYLHSPAAFHALHQNFPFRPWNFLDALSGEMVRPPLWSDPDRVALEVLRHALGRDRSRRDESDFTWGLAEVAKRRADLLPAFQSCPPAL